MITIGMIILVIGIAAVDSISLMPSFVLMLIGMLLMYKGVGKYEK